MLGDCLVWLAADYGVTKDGSDNVVEWENRGNSGENFHQLTVPADRPLWEDNAQNGLPGIKFAAGEFMRHGENAGAGVGFPNDGGEATILAAFIPPKVVASGAAGIFSKWRVDSAYRSVTLNLYNTSTADFSVRGMLSDNGTNWVLDDSTDEYDEDCGAMWAFMQTRCSTQEMRAGVDDAEGYTRSSYYDTVNYDAAIPAYLGAYYMSNNTTPVDHMDKTLLEVVYINKRLEWADIAKFGAYVEGKWGITQPVAAK